MDIGSSPEMGRGTRLENVTGLFYYSDGRLCKWDLPASIRNIILGGFKSTGPLISHIKGTRGRARAAAKIGAKVVSHARRTAFLSIITGCSNGAVQAELVTAPGVAGKSLEEVQRLLPEAGLEMGEKREAYSDTVPAGMIISTTPTSLSPAARRYSYT